MKLQRTALALALAVCFWSCSAKKGPEASEKTEAAAIAIRGDEVDVQPNSPSLSQISVAKVESAEVPTEEVDAPGKIEADPNRVSHVLLPLAGRTTSVLVHLGDSVERGQTLLLMESPDADAAISTAVQAEAGVNSAKSTLLKAQADYEREKDLFQNSAVAQKDVLTAQSALAQAKASLDTANAVLAQAQRRLTVLGLQSNQYGQKVEVRAPISGKILEISVAPNEYRNDTNSSLMTIADLSRVWVSSDVPESKIRYIQPGEEVDLELEAFPGRIFTARVKRIADTVDPTTRTIKVQAELANPNGQLRPEMFGRIRHVESVRVMPLVPVSAVVESEGQNAVYRETGRGQFMRTKVTLGNRLGDRVAIKSGIKAGDRIVVDGVMLLKAQ